MLYNFTHTKHDLHFEQWQRVQKYFCEMSQTLNHKDMIKILLQIKVRTHLLPCICPPVLWAWRGLHNEAGRVRAGSWDGTDGEAGRPADGVRRHR